MRTPALKMAGQKTGDTADTPPAPANYEQTATEPRLDHFVANFLYLCQRLGFFAGRNSDQSQRKIFRGETFADTIAEQSRRSFVGDYGATMSAHDFARGLTSLRQQPMAHERRVTKPIPRNLNYVE